MLIDLHTHSKYSFDAQDKILDLTLSAIEKGFSYIAITDHKDYFWNKEPIALDIESVQNDIDKIRKKFSIFRKWFFYACSQPAVTYRDAWQWFFRSAVF